MDVDYDFFDTPKEPSSSSVHPQHKSTPPTHGHSSSEYSSDEYSSDFSDDDEIPKRKIEAVLPHMTPMEASDHDSDDDDDSGRRAPTPDEASTARSDHFSSSSDPGKSSVKKRAEPAVSKLKPRGMKSKTVHCSDSDDSYTTDTDSDVTDVSPLNSPVTPHIKHRVDFEDVDYKQPHSSKPPVSPKKSARSRPVSAGSTSSKAPSSRMEQLLNANHDSVDMKLLLEAVMEMEKEQGYDTRSRSSTQSKKPKMFKPLGPAPVPKKNYSFNNDNVRTIDLENQRLMQRIVRCATASKKAKAKAKAMKPEPKPTVGTQAATAAVNRRKQQMKIEAENQSMLRRLQSASATRNLQRDKLMREYSKSMLYGYSIAAAHGDTNKKSPYEKLSSPHSRSQSSMTSTGRRSRPHSATNRPPSSQPSQRQRPQSATVRSGTAPGSSSGKHYPTFKPVSDPKSAWDERW